MLPSRVSVLFVALLVLAGLAPISLAEAAELPVVGVGSVSGSEGGRRLDFVVSLDWVSSETVSVSYETRNGSAVAPDDFYDPSAHPVTFAPGETSKTVRISLVDDTLVEPTESFTVVLSLPVNAAIGAGTGTGTILDNDSGVISGRVTDESTGNPIQGIRVRVCARGTDTCQTVRTGSSGDYSVSGLPAGGYWVLFKGTSTYVGEWWNDGPTVADREPVRVVAGRTRSGVDAALTATPVLSPAPSPTRPPAYPSRTSR